LLQGFGFGLGLLFGVLNAFFRDIGQVVNLFLQLWFWATPIVYTENILPESLKSWLFLNPAYPFIHSLQAIIVDQVWPAGNMWAAMILLAFVFPLLGYLLLRKLRPELRDVL
jgi:lipopolysaccharide transport system permease protein